jgi:RNA-binding protein
MLTKEQKRQLKAQAHHLNPVVTAGQNGMTDNLIAEINHALDTHEIIKLRINTAERDARKEMVAQICEKTTAELIDAIGHVAVIFRKRPKKKADPKRKPKKSKKNRLKKTPTKPAQAKRQLTRRR